uniref:Glycosyl transferase family 2 n=1 Tax=Geobacter sp. (strain M21) TaxID=443144 RepID=C6DZV2_GEOSM
MCNKTPYVSVVIPAKNESAIIGWCLLALNQLRYRQDRIEVIVVDNGSTDETVGIAKQSGASVFVRPGLTISGLRNFGVRQARGEFIAFVDADVIVSADWLRNAMDCFSEEVACVGCSPAIPEHATWVEKTWHLQVTSRGARCERDWIASMNMVIRRSAFEAVGGFDETLVTCEDVDLGYRIRRAGLKILYDTTISAVHYGEAKTLVQLFKKESWRGISNFKGVARHGIVLAELPSHAVALLYLLLVLTFPVLFFSPSTLIIPWLSLSLIFPIVKAVALASRLNRHDQLLRLLCVWYVYGFARGWSGFRCLFTQNGRGTLAKSAPSDNV